MDADDAPVPVKWGAKATYERYVELLPDYEDALDQSVIRLTEYLDLLGLTPFRIDARPKTPVSLYQKQLKKTTRILGAIVRIFSA